MLQIKSLTFNPFSENTYILYDETKEALIIDPGCYEKQEKGILYDFITEEQLKPVKIINTHCHIDHVLGNAFIKKRTIFPCGFMKRGAYLVGCWHLCAQLWLLRNTKKAR